MPTQGVTPSEFREVFDADKTRMIGLRYGEKSMTICLAVFTWYRNITDRQTDRQNCCINIACDKKTLPFFVFTITCHMPADLAHFLHRYKWVVLQHISAYLLINSRKSSRQWSTVALPETCLFSNTIALETQWHAGARTRDTLAPQAAFDWPRPAVTEHSWCESGGLHRCVAKTAPPCLTRVIWSSCAWLRHDLVLKITLLTWRLTTGVSSCVVTWELMTTLWTFALSHWLVFFVNWQSSEFTVCLRNDFIPPYLHLATSEM